MPVLTVPALPSKLLNRVLFPILYIFPVPVDVYGCGYSFYCKWFGGQPYIMGHCTVAARLSFINTCLGPIPEFKPAENILIISAWNIGPRSSMITRPYIPLPYNPLPIYAPPLPPWLPRKLNIFKMYYHKFYKNKDVCTFCPDFCSDWSYI